MIPLPFGIAWKYLLIGLAGLAVVTVIFLGFKHYERQLENEKREAINAALAETRARAEEVARMANEAAQRIAEESRKQAEKEIESARSSETETLKTLQEHDLDFLLQHKPGLVVRRATDGTNRLFSRSAETINSFAASTDPVQQPAED